MDTPAPLPPRPAPAVARGWPARGRTPAAVPAAPPRTARPPKLAAPRRRGHHGSPREPTRAPLPPTPRAAAPHVGSGPTRNRGDRGDHSRSPGGRRPPTQHPHLAPPRADGTKPPMPTAAGHPSGHLSSSPRRQGSPEHRRSTPNPSLRRSHRQAARRAHAEISGPDPPPIPPIRVSLHAASPRPAGGERAPGPTRRPPIRGSVHPIRASDRLPPPRRRAPAPRSPQPSHPGAALAWDGRHNVMAETRRVPSHTATTRLPNAGWPSAPQYRPFPRNHRMGESAEPGQCRRPPRRAARRPHRIAPPSDPRRGRCARPTGRPTRDCAAAGRKLRGA